MSQRTWEDRQRWVRQGRKDLEEWRKQEKDIAGARHGFDIGRPFPLVPVLWDGSEGEVVVPGRPAVVVMAWEINRDAELKELSAWKRMMDRAPGIDLVVLTSEPAFAVIRNAAAARHPRIRYLRVDRHYLERMSIYGEPVVYVVDRAGVIRRRHLLKAGAKVSNIGPLLNAAG